MSSSASGYVTWRNWAPSFAMCRRAVNATTVVPAPGLARSAAERSAAHRLARAPHPHHVARAIAGGAGQRAEQRAGHDVLEPGDGTEPAELHQRALERRRLGARRRGDRDGKKESGERRVSSEGGHG